VPWCSNWVMARTVGFGPCPAAADDAIDPSAAANGSRGPRLLRGRGA
jgi:hypothetical protein